MSSKYDTNEMKKELEKLFDDFISILGIPIDNNIKDTPKRMAKMYVDELLNGMYTKMPVITKFENKNKIDVMQIIGPINVNSICSHHFIPFIGSCYIGYIPDKYIAGISKFARIVDWFSRRPQIQEELVNQIADLLMKELSPRGIGVYIKAQHGCMRIRGVKESDVMMISTALRGIFTKQEVKIEFLGYIK